MENINRTPLQRLSIDEIENELSNINTGKYVIYVNLWNNMGIYISNSGEKKDYEFIIGEVELHDKKLIDEFSNDVNKIIKNYLLNRQKETKEKYNLLVSLFEENVKEFDCEIIVVEKDFLIALQGDNFQIKYSIPREELTTYIVNEYGLPYFQFINANQKCDVALRASRFEHCKEKTEMIKFFKILEKLNK